jgi:hypothetical protein
VKNRFDIQFDVEAVPGTPDIKTILF